jgi:hypothetical protein
MTGKECNVQKACCGDIAWQHDAWDKPGGVRFSKEDKPDKKLTRLSRSLIL